MKIPWHIVGTTHYWKDTWHRRLKNDWHNLATTVNLTVAVFGSLVRELNANLPENLLGFWRTERELRPRFFYFCPSLSSLFFSRVLLWSLFDVTFKSRLLFFVVVVARMSMIEPPSVVWHHFWCDTTFPPLVVFFQFSTWGVLSVSLVSFVFQLSFLRCVASFHFFFKNVRIKSLLST